MGGKEGVKLAIILGIKKLGAVEMAQLLRADWLFLLKTGQGYCSQHLQGCLLSALTVSGDLEPSSGLLGCCMHMVHIHTGKEILICISKQTEAPLCVFSPWPSWL